MPRIALFGGVVPRLAPRLLADNQAQTALNCRLLNGDLRAWKSLGSVVTPSKAGTKQSIYRFGQDVSNEAQYWFHWTADVNVVRGPVAGDTSERTYYTGDGVPKVTDSAIALTAGTDYPMNSYTLGLPAPAAAPTLGVTGSGTGPVVTRAYVYTYVTAWGEEGPPSAAASIDWQSGQTVGLSAMSTGPGAGYNVSYKRIYRSNVGTNGTDYQYVGQVAVATTTYADTIADADLGAAMESTTWIAPPTDMHSLIEVGNGFMAGLSGNQLCLSEPFVPSAWPSRYRKAMGFKGVGLGAIGQTVVACTNGYPYFGTGMDPSSFSFDPIKYAPACVSKRSIAGIKGVGVAYAAPKSLWIVGPDGLARDALGQFLDPRDWEALVPSSMNAYDFNGRYFCFYSTGSATGGLIFDPNDPNAALTFTDVYATAGYNDPQRDSLYLQVGSDIKKWDGGASNLSYTWKSKIMVPGRPTNYGAASVDGGQSVGTPVTAKFYVDGALKHTATVTSDAGFRLPSGFKGKEFEVELTGTTEVKAVYMAETMAGLNRV